jgi:hypothetical protein
VDLGTVRDIARVRINGKDLDARGWAPYVWDITDSVKPGDNTLEVTVQVGSIGGGDRGFGGGGGGAGRAGAGAGRGGRAGRGAAAAGEVTTNPAQAGAARAGGRGRGAGAGAAGETNAAASPLGLIGPVHVIAQ